MKTASTPHYVALDTQLHQQLKISQSNRFQHAKTENICRAGFTEIVSLSSCMPVVILAASEQRPAAIAAMMGLEDGQNLFVSDNDWLGHSVPLSIQSAPFNYATEEQKLIVLIDQNSDAISDSGKAIFSSDGTPTPLLKQHQRMLGDLAQGLSLNQQFIATLEKLKLLSKLNIVLTYADQQQRTITGCLSIDDNALANLDDATIGQLHRSGMLMAINAMMLSLRQFNRLVQLSKNTEQPVASIKISVSE